MIEQVLKPKNLCKAYRQVVRNKGAAGIDHMTIHELLSYLDDHRDQVINSIANGTYVPKAILGVEIPKSNGKKRLLEIPTVVDRWLQQAGVYTMYGTRTISAFMQNRKWKLER